MKKSLTALFTGALFFTMAMPGAEARTFTVKEVRTECRNEGENTVAGALIGGAIGCAAGFIIGDNGRSCVKGAAIGGVAGGILGFASSCKDRVRYITYFDRALDSRRVSRQYERWDGDVSGRIIAEGRHRTLGYECKKYETQIGHSYYSTVACRDHGVWRHNYNNYDFVERSSYSSREDRYSDDLDDEDDADLDEDYTPRRKKCCKPSCHQPSYPAYPSGGVYYYQYQYQYQYGY